MGEINFGVGNPDPGSFPSQALAEATARVLARQGATLAVYPEQKGYPGLREIAAERFKKNNGLELPLDNIALTTGSMQAISLVCQTYLEPGDTIITEEFTYSGSINCFRKYGVKMAGVTVDDDGMNMDSLEEKLKELDGRGIQPKFLYTIATNQNPTGTMLPESRRRRMVELTNQYGIPVVDDDCYADLLFGDPAPPSLYSIDPDSVIYIGSFSKILGPGVRLGFFAAKPETLEKVLYWKIDGGTSNLAAYIAAEYFKDHLWDHVGEINGIVREKLEAVVSELDAHPGAFVSHSNPKGGLFIWVKLPDEVDPVRLMDISLARGVRFGSGKAFHAAGDDIPYLRIAYAYSSLDEIHTGIPILAECIEEARALAVRAG